jgi:hypothetical protein
VAWFKTIIDELGEDLVQMCAHALRVLGFLLLELGLSLFLDLSQLKRIAPLTDPILKAAIPGNVLVFCFQLLYILALKAWQEVRRRLHEGQIGWRPALAILVALLLIGLITIIGGPHTEATFFGLEEGPCRSGCAARFDQVG